MLKLVTAVNIRQQKLTRACKVTSCVSLYVTPEGSKSTGVYPHAQKVKYRNGPRLSSQLEPLLWYCFNFFIYLHWTTTAYSSIWSPRNTLPDGCSQLPVGSGTYDAGNILAKSKCIWINAYWAYKAWSISDLCLLSVYQLSKAPCCALLDSETTGGCRVGDGAFEMLYEQQWQQVITAFFQDGTQEQA